MLLLVVGGCAYYNYYYNASRYYREGERQRMEQGEAGEGGQRKGGLTNYDKCIESAGRMLQYYPNSRWEDDALLLLAKAYYRTGKYRQAIVKIDELTAKYPNSELVGEGRLWKGMSLLQVAQPDSARMLLSQLLAEDAPVWLRAKACFALAEFHYQLEQWEQALDHYQRVMDLALEDEWMRGQVWLRIGDCLRRLGKLQEAIILYDGVLARKPSRNLEFQVRLEKGIALRQLGRWNEALDLFEGLLRDAAYLKEFPRLELEAALTMKAMGRDEDARSRLEKLDDSEKKGEVAVRTQYELGTLIWERWRDFVPARNALKEVGKLDRSSPWAARADSLVREMDELSRRWQRIGFLQSQIVCIDSAYAGLREMLPADTTYVDSVALLIGPEKKEPQKRGYFERGELARGKKRKGEEEKSQPDTVATVSLDTSVALDSAALASLRRQRADALSRARLDLASYHLFSRSDRDSAACYFRVLLGDSVASEVWGRAVASLAYLAQMLGDTARHDSLYQLILARMPDSPLGEGARRALGLPTPEAEADTAQVLLDEAEKAWMEEGDPARAREVYLQVAGIADSASGLRPRAILAAAYLSTRILSDDSSATAFYQTLVDEFADTDYGRLARRRLLKIQGVKSPEEKRPVPEEMPPEFGLYGTGFEEEEPDLTPETTGGGERIFESDEVDDPPQLVTSPSMMKNYVRSYFPFKAFNEEVNGTVQVELVVGISGEISGAEVVQVDPEGYGFEDAALQVLEKLRYRPGRYRGRQVAVKIKQELVFNLEEAAK